MLRSTLVGLALLSTIPTHVAAQVGVGLGGRIGTLGLGGEVAVELSERFVVRGGIGFMPYDPTLTLGDIEVDLSLPTVYNVGADLYLNGAMRIGGGMMFRASDPELSARFTQPQDIGGTTYTPQEIGTLLGVLDSNDSAPYVLIGFGKHTAGGAGLFVDFGVAFVGEPAVGLDVTGGSLDPDTNPGLRSALDQEAAEFEEDVGGYLKFYPILNFGFRLGAY